MIESTTVTTLRSKAEEIEHRIKGYEREIEIAKKNLVAVNMTLAIFESDPNAPYAPRSYCRRRLVGCHVSRRGH